MLYKGENGVEDFFGLPSDIDINESTKLSWLSKGAERRSNGFKHAPEDKKARSR